MFYYFHFLRSIYSWLNIFRYITVRAALGSITAFFISMLITYRLISFLKRHKIKEPLREEKDFILHNNFKHKEGTPGMGGIAIILAIVLSTLLWADIFNPYIRLCLFSIIYLGLVGFWDDYLKFIRGNSQGLKPRWKFLAQIFLGLLVGIIFYFDPVIDHHLEFPFLKGFFLNLGIFYIIFSTLVIVGSSNAVNLTDGLDGLAMGSLIMVGLAYTGMCYISGNYRLSHYLIVSHIPLAGELTVFMACFVGAGLGFLWHNCYPASIFMGDTGALSLGGIIGIVALLVKKEILLILVGGIFVTEAVSVILQIVSFRWRKKRIFLMAPLHHHFQLKGLAEPKIIVRFWIIAGILALLSLTTFKIR
ncbi:MAG: phospho-N-acetylmuramoyl-pentapeptide-transferase [Candidatus Omnitrophica bacterium]|nr:phospho-N-acetylmuramoyl-pentapeptide-transferase [Candidatus Omnitrophota bacterium]MCM8793005.1 phospho-N-acetylmuramoyl-pentapeptide-transferase [Candidatus Omnitrophota bacterium]